MLFYMIVFFILSFALIGIVISRRRHPKPSVDKAPHHHSGTANASHTHSGSKQRKERARRRKQSAQARRKRRGH